jgi:putative membrane protein
MSKRSPYRRPAIFKLDDANVVVTDPNEESHPSRGTIQVTPEDETPQLPVAIEPTILPAERRFRWGTLFWSAVGGLVLLGAGLAVAHLIEDLFARSDGLGILGLVLTFAATLSFLVVAAREAIGLMRLSTIEHLHRRAAAVILSDDRNESRDVLRDLLKIAHANPHLARARATLSHHTGDIIDGADMIRLAERELMSPLDQEARFLISAAAQRVSLVTAISPRALFDVAFVLAARPALWRPARHARPDQTDAPRAGASCDHRRHGGERQRDPAGAWPWAGGKTVAAARRRLPQWASDRAARIGGD